MPTSSTITRNLPAVPTRYGVSGANTPLSFSFTFQNPVLNGTFVMGDYYVVNSGGVTLTADLPAFSAAASGTTPGSAGSVTYSGQSINGMMVNPGLGGGEDSPAQGFTSLDKKVYGQNTAGAKAWDSLLNVATGALGPLVLAAGAESSLVKSANLSPALATSLGVQDGRPTLQGVEILTVVSAAPPAGSFRPGPSAASKASWCNVSMINYGRLPRLSQAALGLTVDFAGIAVTVSRAYQVWFTANTAGSRNINSYDHHPEYGRDIAYLLNEALCAALLDADLETQIKPIVHGLIQVAIDIADRIAQGGRYIGNGGGEQWRMMPLMFAYALTRGTTAGDRFAAALVNASATFAECEQITRVTHAMQIQQRDFLSYGTSVGSGGRGYAVNDLVTYLGGEYLTTPATIQVKQVDANGTILSKATAFVLVNSPDYLRVPDVNTPTTTNGAGTGCLMSINRPIDAYFPFMIGSAEFLNDGITGPGYPGFSNASSHDHAEYRGTFGPATPGWLLAMTQFPEVNAIVNYPATLEYCRRYWWRWKDDAIQGNRDANQGMHSLPWNMLNTFFVDDLTPPAPTGAFIDAMLDNVGNPVQAWVALPFDRYLSETAALPAVTDFTVTVAGTNYPVASVRAWGIGFGLKLATVPPTGVGPVNVSYVKGSNPILSAPGTPIAAGFTRLNIPNKIALLNPAAKLNLVTASGSADSPYATLTRQSVGGQKYYTFVWKGIIAPNAYGNVYCDYGGTKFKLFINANNGVTAQIRLYFMGSGTITAKLFSVPVGVLMTFGFQIDVTQPTIAGLRGFWKPEGGNATLVPGTSMSSVVWNPPASFDTGYGIGSAPMAIMGQSGGAGRLAGALLYLTEAWSATPGPLYPDFSNPAICNACDLPLGAAGIDGSQIFGGSRPQAFYAASQEDDVNAIGILNRGSAPNIDALKQGAEGFIFAALGPVVDPLVGRRGGWVGRRAPIRL